MTPARTLRLLAGLGRALAQIAIVAWASATLAFATLQLTPGNPIDVLLVASPDAPAQARAELSAYYGLDRPLVVQYFSYLTHLLTGDLGFSYRQQRPVADIIGDAAVPTARLALMAIAFVALFVIVAAVISSARSRWVSRAVTGVELLLISIPAFWLAIGLLTQFSFTWQWFPAAGDAGLGSLVLPAATLALVVGARVSRVFRQGIEATAEEPFIVTARARGLGSTRILLAHSSRHALLGTITLAGLAFAELLGGAVIAETVFSRPGVGRELTTAVVSKDIPVVMGFVVLAGIVFAVVNRVVDGLYRRIDPRVELRT